VSAVRTVHVFGAAILALTTSAWSFAAVAQEAAPPAPAAETTPPAKKPAHHAHKMVAKAKKADTKSGDTAVDDLNAASLTAAKENKPFTPPVTPVAAKTEVKKPAKAMHKKVKKAAAPAAAPADATPPATK